MRRPLAVVSILLSQLLGAQAAWAQTDEELLDQTEAQAAIYFWDQTFGGDAIAQWFVFDRDDMPQRSSIAATGFGLAALVPIGECYGTSSEWAVTPLEAQTRAQQILQAAVDIQAVQADDPTYLYGTGVAPSRHETDRNHPALRRKSTRTLGVTEVLRTAIRP